MEEKPLEPEFNDSVTGLYLYDYQVVEIEKNLEHSPWSEYEITDLNKIFLEKGELGIMDLGTAWLNIGIFESLQED